MINPVMRRVGRPAGPRAGSVGRSRQVVIIRSVDPSQDEGDGMPALGTVKEVRSTLGRYNTAGDSAPSGRNAEMNIATLFGPGLICEMSTADDEVRQLMVTMTDEDFAFPVLTRLCRENKWTMMDPESGQRLRFGF